MNPFFLSESTKIPMELRSAGLHPGHHTTDWISLTKVSHRSLTPLFSDPGSSFSSVGHHLGPGLKSGSSEAGAWSDTDFRSSSSDSDDVSRSAIKSGKSERYKTEMCRSFEETGFCKYREKCQFAHGVLELRTVQRHPKYKTDLCRTYHSTGFCPYGSRCHFVHAELPPSATTSPSNHPQSPLGPSEVQFQFREQNCQNASLDRNPGVSREQLEQFLDAFNRVLQAVSCRPSSPQSPSSTPPNFEVIARQDSVFSGSLRSTPDRLPTPTASMHDDKRNPYSRFSSCSSDNEVFQSHSHSHSPNTSPTSFFGSNTLDPLSSFWARASRIPLSSLVQSSVGYHDGFSN